MVDECPEWYAPERTMLGREQEVWLDGQLKGSHARWDLIAQSVVFTTLDEDPGPRIRHWSDSWPGYPAAYRRLLDSIVGSGARNPLILGGDIHAFIAADQRLRADDPASPIVASELVTTSVTSDPPPKRLREVFRRPGNDVSFYDDERRGYLWMELTPRRIEAELRGYDSVREASRPTERTLFACRLEDGVRGLQRT